MANYRKIKGTQDFIGIDADKFRYIEKQAKNVASRYGFKEIITPIFEYTQVFNRIGEDSDIVNKEMYTFLDRGKRSITLRPEGTAPVVRSLIENKLYASQRELPKYFYFGPIFRYERPQAGRFRQFHQFGVEIFDIDSPLLDADVIISGYMFIKELNIDNITLKINTIGDFQSRNDYSKELVKYFNNYQDDLCNDCLNRLSSNPLRILDCKVDRDKDFMKAVPLIKDFLSDESKVYFNKILEILEQHHIKYEIDDTLVRGLDYYTDTVFEYIINSDDELNGLALGAGGKYSNLVSDLGGPQIPGIGYAFGIERIIEILNNKDNWPVLDEHKKVFIMALDEKSKLESIKMANFLRQHNLYAELDYLNYTMKKQFRLSDKVKADYIIIIGEEERLNNQVTIKNTKENIQETIKTEDLLKYLLKTDNVKEVFKYENS